MGGSRSIASAVTTTAAVIADRAAADQGAELVVGRVGSRDGATVDAG